MRRESRCFPPTGCLIRRFSPLVTSSLSQEQLDDMLAQELGNLNINEFDDDEAVVREDHATHQVRHRKTPREDPEDRQRSRNSEEGVDLVGEQPRACEGPTPVRPNRHDRRQPEWAHDSDSEVEKEEDTKSADEGTKEVLRRCWSSACGIVSTLRPANTLRCTPPACSSPGLHLACTSPAPHRTPRLCSGDLQD